MITEKTMKLGLAKVASEVVGKHLSVTNGTSSVYFARKSEPYTNYPFIIVDKISGGVSGGWGLDRYINGDDDEVFENVLMYIFSFQVFDKADRDGTEHSSDIANKLKSYLEQVPKIRAKVKEYSQATLEQVFDVSDRSFKTKDGYVSSYGFNVTLVATDIIKDEDPDFFDVVNVEVDLLQHVDDEEPLTITVNTELQP